MQATQGQDTLDVAMLVCTGLLGNALRQVFRGYDSGLKAKNKRNKSNEAVQYKNINEMVVKPKG